MYGSRKCLYPHPHGGFFFGFHPPPQPSGNSNLVPYFSLKMFALATPLCLGISIDFPLCRRYGYFLEVHNTKCFAFWQRCKRDHEISAPFNVVCNYKID